MPRAGCGLDMICEVVKVENGVYVENQARSRATLGDKTSPPCSEEKRAPFLTPSRVHPMKLFLPSKQTPLSSLEDVSPLPTRACPPHPRYPFRALLLAFSPLTL